jgi:hypothetical protein
MRAGSVQLVALLLAAGLVTASTLLVPAINTERRDELNMLGAEDLTLSAPPEYAFLVQAFGAFRGVITNYLFIRLEHHKEQGQYYDAMQLATWIARLQPRFPSVWEFLSWNMAWNISVTTHTPEERWQWVYNGARLVRDEGLRYNPRAVNLYRQLAWIFVNKMSETTDEYHMTYKRNWAWRMHLLLGPPPDPLGDYRPDRPFVVPAGSIGDDELTDAVRRARLRRDQRLGRDTPEDIAREPEPRERAQTFVTPADVAKRAFYDALMEIDSAPRSLPELFERTPDARRMITELRELGAAINDDRLDEDAYWNDQGLSVKFFVRYRRLADRPAILDRVLTEAKQSQIESLIDPQLERFDQVVGASRGDPTGRAVLLFLQRKILTEVYKLEPKQMAELVNLFGPIDWRVVDAHSLYWVNQALIAGSETISEIRNDKTNTARLIFFSLRNLFNRNRLVFEPYYPNVALSYLSFNPDLNFIPTMHEAYLTYGRTIAGDPNEPGAGQTFRSGHANFLAEAIRLLFFAGRQQEAAEYYAWLQDNYGHDYTGELSIDYDKTLRDFVIDTFLEADLNWRDARARLGAAFMAAFEQLAEGNRAQYHEMMTAARTVHERFHEEPVPAGVIDKTGMPPFGEMVRDALLEWLREPSLNELMVLDKARLWQQLPVELAQGVYDEMSAQFRGECELAGFEVARAFPEPPDMAGYRERRGTRHERERETGVETPAQPF